VLEEFLTWLIERADAIDPTRHHEAWREIQAIIAHVEALVLFDSMK
jgi:hypothetical protein